MTTENKDTVKISGKAIAVIGILLLLLAGTFGMFAFNKSSHNSNTSVANVQADSKSGDIPEKCKIPDGQNVNSWKEHLGHHAETKECLKYFN